MSLWKLLLWNFDKQTWKKIIQTSGMIENFLFLYMAKTFFILLWWQILPFARTENFDTTQPWQKLWSKFVNWILWKSEREQDGHGNNSQRSWQEAENRQRKKFWQCVYAALSLTCVSVFIAILLFLFFIFHNLDNKPWTSIFPNLFYENNWRKEEKTLQYFYLSDDIFLINMNLLNFEMNFPD